MFQTVLAGHLFRTAIVGQPNRDCYKEVSLVLYALRNVGYCLVAKFVEVHLVTHLFSRWSLNVPVYECSLTASTPLCVCVCACSILSPWLKCI